MFMNIKKYFVSVTCVLDWDVIKICVNIVTCEGRQLAGVKEMEDGPP